MKKVYTVGSMFAGIGGICLAFKQAGCIISWANEYNQNACKTYKHNFPETYLLESDVRYVNSKDLKEVDIITSGFPCQAFSVAGYREGFSDKKGRGNLFFETARLIQDLKPKAYLLENVKNIVSHDKGNTLKIIRNTLVNDLKYSFIPLILNAKDYGNVPQTRERIYIIGFRGENHYNIDDNEKKAEILTHLFKIPEIIPLNKTIHDILDHTKQDEKFYYKESHQYYETLKSELKSKDTIYQWRRVYVRENKNKLCPTLTANMGTGGHNVPLIIDNYGFRKLTPIECLRFQGFSGNYNFPDELALSHRYKQVGNSVVVPVVKRIADEIVRVLNTKFGGDK